MALTSLYANKMRSLLTMLGIIIGVGAVIALVSVGMGVRSNVTSSIASLGSNMLIVDTNILAYRIILGKEIGRNGGANYGNAVAFIHIIR